MASSEEKLDAYRRTVTIMAVIVVLYLSFLIVRPFLIAIIGAGVLAYLFYPLYKWLEKSFPRFLPSESLAAFVTVLLIIVIVLVPMVFITTILTREARDGYFFLQDLLNRPEFTWNIDLPPVLGREIGSLAQFKPQIIGLASQFVVWLQQVLRRLPGAFLNIFITIFSVYFFLKGGVGLRAFLEGCFPLPAGRYQQIASRFGEISRGIFLGQIMVGVIHGFISWAAYYFLGVPNPVLWAFLTAIISVIPVLGAGLVWFPVALYLFLSGLPVGPYWKGLALFVYGLVLMSGIDNFVKPKIIGANARIHPLLVLFGILGGIQLFGLPGILLGPMILALFDIVIEILREVI